MESVEIKRTLKEFKGTRRYYKHLFPGKSPILLTDGCNYLRNVCKAYWLFDTILSYQCDIVLRNANFQIWELRRLKKDLSWLLTCREESGKKPILSQTIEFSDFPLDDIIIWVIGRAAILPSEY
jgi:hypothetical protein